MGPTPAGSPHSLHTTTATLIQDATILNLGPAVTPHRLPRPLCSPCPLISHKQEEHRHPASVYSLPLVSHSENKGKMSWHGTGTQIPSMYPVNSIFRIYPESEHGSPPLLQKPWSKPPSSSPGSLLTAHPAFPAFRVS